jgi:DNA-binding LacI/PurR family transcriptional regulator
VLLNTKVTTLRGDVPKYLEISRRIRGLIVAGTIAPGQRLPSELKLAEAFGVSQISIRNALKKLNEEGYVASKHGKGSFVEQPECFFSKAKADIIGFYTDVSRQCYVHFPTILHGISTTAHQYGLNLQIINIGANGNGIHSDKKLVTLIEDRKIDGLIVDLPRQRVGVSWDDYYYLDRSGVPFVLWGNYKDAKGRNLVTACDSNWLEDLMQQMVGKGHRKIALVLGPIDPPDAFSSSNAQHLLPIYKRVTRELFMPIRPEYIVQADYSVESGYIAGKQLLSLKTRPEVIIAADDVNAIGIIKAAMDMGIKVPEELKIWGVGDFLPGSNISSVSFDWEHAGRKAVSELVHLIEGECMEQLPMGYSFVFCASTGVEDERNSLKTFVQEYLHRYPMDKKKLEDAGKGVKHAEK